MNQLGGRNGEARAMPVARGRFVGETTPYREEHVGIRGQLSANGSALGAGQPAGERVRLGENALARQRRQHGRAQVLRELPQLRRSIGEQRPAPGDDSRALCANEQLRRLLHSVRVRRRFLGEDALGHVRYLDVGLFALHAHGQLNVYGPAAAGHHRRQGTLHDEGHLPRAGGLPRPLHHGLQHTKEIARLAALDLLEHPLPEHVQVRAAGEDHDRGRVDIARRRADDRVARAWANGGERRQWMPAGPVVAVGHVDRSVLLADVQDADTVLPSYEGIRKPQAPVSRNAQHIRHARRDQTLRHNLTASQLHTLTTLS